MRKAIACVAAILLLAGCGGGSPSVNDYVEALNALNDEYSPRGEAMWLEYTKNPAPAVDDLRVLLDTNLELRTDVEDALGEVEAPEQIADLHDRWLAWHSGLLAAERAQVARAATASSLDEFVQSAEFDGWAESLREGSALCAEYEGTLNSTEAQELFAGTPWMPSDLTEVVHAVIGCESFPDDFDDLATIFNP